MLQLDLTDWLTASLRNPTSVYVVYQPAQIFDECRNWIGGVAGPAVTLSYPANALSTLQYQSNGPPATKAINYADLPCPPTDVAKVYNPKTPYYPVLKSEFGVKFNLHAYIDEQYRTVGDEPCKITAVRDPPVYSEWVGPVTGATDESGIIA